MIAALYVDKRGPYPAFPNVEVWAAPDRDARCYMGPHPVVAHPPCGNYSHLRHLRSYDDSDCALRAVEQVRAYGGVLEHPAHSKLWDLAFDFGRLPRPGDPRDAAGGYTIEIQQCEWGHVARKRTWLYLVGVSLHALEDPPYPGRKPTHSMGNSHAKRLKLGLRECSRQLRNRTPPLFAQYLIRLAESYLPEYR